MCQGTLNLLTYVLPAVTLRQWVLTLPFELRAPLAYQRDLMGAVARIFADSVMGWYRRRLAPGVPEARGGVVTVIQRASSDMKLNPHLHAIAVDGVFVPGPDGQPSFRALPRLKTDEVGDVLQIARVRILRYLARRGVVRLLPEALEVSDDLAERAPVLAQLAAAAVSGLPVPSGPRACHPCPCPTRLRRARRPLTVPSCAAVPPCSLRAPTARVPRRWARWSCKSWGSIFTRQASPALRTNRRASACCATCSGPRWPKSASPSCPTTACAFP
jgi:hypothetical protein